MNKKLLKLFIIPLFVTLIYFVLASIPYFTQFGITSVVEERNVNFENNIEFGDPLLKNKKVTGTFKASENNLGILLIRFIKFGRGSDTLVFGIKREGDTQWYYENKYFGELFQNSQYFPFGFPIISNSKNNSYIFEIKSLSGKSQTGVGISKNKPQTAFIYSYPVSELKNPGVFFSFTFKKSIYVLKNIDYFKLAGIFVLSTIFVFLAKKNNITLSRTISFLLVLKKRPRRTLKGIINKIKSYYLLIERKIARFFKRFARVFTSTRIYLLFLNSNRKKRLAIGIFIFLLAFTYRFSTSLIDQSSLFYASLGGQGDYDQFIRAATCAVREFCPEILHQNLLVESSILGTFYAVFGFIGGLKVYLLFMIVVSSIVSILPYLLLSRRNWVSVGGILGGLYLATSDFLTQIALSYPPDNLSLFTFSMFYVVYFLTLNTGTIRWLLLFGLVGLIDGMNKALFLINDLVAFLLFVPVFFFERLKQKSKTLFQRKNINILLLSLIPLLVFLIIYSGWEYYVYAKWTARYFLGGLIVTGGVNFVSYTSFNGNSLTGNMILNVLYLIISAVVMVKRVIIYADIRIVFLLPIFLGSLWFTFSRIPNKDVIKKIILSLISTALLLLVLILIRNDYYNIHNVFPSEYFKQQWTEFVYVKIFLFAEIIILFLLNFRLSALRLTLPIVPYVVMLVILTKNSPFPRLSIHVVVWAIIFLAFLIDFIIANLVKRSVQRTKVLAGGVLLISFAIFYILPSLVNVSLHIQTGLRTIENKTSYLRWVEDNLPENAVVLAGGKSDLVVLAQNVKRPIIYSSLYSAALLIKPNEIPGIKPTDFTIIGELQNKNNFKKKKYFILEDDIYLWRSRLVGIADGVFTADPNITTLLHGDDYSIEVYKSNSGFKKRIYELKLKESEDAK